MDMQSDRVTELLERSASLFRRRHHDQQEWIEYHIKKCDTVLPLVAIATPATYVKEPLRVFESTSRRTCRSSAPASGIGSASSSRRRPRSTECAQTTSSIRSAPIWCWADQQAALDLLVAKQLMDRVIHAYGMQEGSTTRCFARSTGSAPGSIRSTRRKRAVRASSRSSSVASCAAKRSSSSTAARRSGRSRTSTTWIAALMKIIANKDSIAARKSTTSATRPTTSRCASSRL